MYLAIYNDMPTVSN